jgi:DNA-binding transcriptional LysR family regulator
MDRLDELIVLTSILEAGSLAGAARRLRRSSPAVTRSLAALEQRVGTRLVERTTRRLSATDAGKRFAAQAAALLADYGNAVANATQERDTRLEGALRVTAPALFGRWHVAPLVATFLDVHPGIRIELLLADHDIDLLQEGVDVAIRIGPLADSTLVARRVGQVRHVVYASPDYIARRGRPRTPKDLQKHDIVFNSRRRSPIQWRFRVSSRDRVVRLTPKLMTNDMETIIDAVKAGRGIGRALSYQVADDFSAGSLVRLLTRFELPARPVHVIVPSTRHMRPSVRAFLDLAVRGLQALPVIHD